MIDFNAPAELYPGRNLSSGRTARYQRFPSLAEAIQFTVEKLPVPIQPSSLIEASGIRYGGTAIRELYFSHDYPLPRSFIGSVRPHGVTI